MGIIFAWDQLLKDGLGHQVKSSSCTDDRCPPWMTELPASYTPPCIAPARNRSTCPKAPQQAVQVLLRQNGSPEPWLVGMLSGQVDLD